MADVDLPLLSASAQGSIGRVLTFSRRNGRQKVRFQRRQSYAATDNQIPRRLMIAQAVDNWQGFSSATKATWDALAVGKQMSGYNLYVSDYLSTADTPEIRSYFGSRSYGYFHYAQQLV